MTKPGCLILKIVSFIQVSGMLRIAKDVLIFQPVDLFHTN